MFLIHINFTAYCSSRYYAEDNHSINIKQTLSVDGKTGLTLQPINGVGEMNEKGKFNLLNPELNPICYLLALLAHHFLHVSRIRVKSLTLRLLMLYIYIYIWSAYS